MGLFFRSDGDVELRLIEPQVALPAWASQLTRQVCRGEGQVALKILKFPPVLARQLRALD